MRKSLCLVMTAALVAGACRKSETPAPAASGPASTGVESPTPAASAPAGDAEPSGGTAKKPGPPAEPMNVILLLVDSMRADMPWAGYPRDIAPNLTALEKESISYTRGYALSSYTAKSVAGLLAGKYPSSLLRSGVFFTRYPEANLFLPELLQKAGSYNLSTHGHMYMRGQNGLEQGFDDWKVVPGITFNAQTDNHVTSHKMTPLIIEQLAKVPPGKPFFLYAHYMDPHDQYVKHKETPDFGSKIRDKYDSEMFYTDMWIGKLLEHCKAQPWWKSTLVIVSADHGEAFGEHGMYRHAFELWNMLTHVPLFFRVPGAQPRRIDTPRSHIDIAPTVAELMKATGEHDFVGKSLVPEFYGAEPEPRPVLLDLPEDSNNPQRRALIDGDLKLLVFEKDYRFELYDLKTDPGEKQNLAKTEPEKLAAMKALYEKTWGAVKTVKPYGGNKLKSGGTANGPMK
ncbi:MAG TPA: sulfatase-like hydrolase/transferase [Polyangiaceae bacterium]